MQNAPRALATPAIYEMANVEHLGNIVATLDTKKLIKSKRISGISMLLGGTVAALIGIGLLTSGGGSFVAIFFGFILCVIGPYMMYGSRQPLGTSLQLTHNGEKMQVYICDNGLIVVQNNMPPQPLPWETLLVWRSATEHRTRLRYGGQITTGFTFAFTLQRDDGYKVVIDNNLNDLHLLELHLRLHLLQARLPGYLAAYKAGKTLDFGRLTLSQQGIGNGREVLPWASVRAIDAKSGSISVQSSAGDRLSWRSIPAESIPNVFVFLALTDTILKKAGRL